MKLWSDIKGFFKSLFTDIDPPRYIEVKNYNNANWDLFLKNEKGDWIDLRIAEDVTMKRGEFKLLNLGIAMRLPKGYEAIVLPRSSTFKNYGIIMTNGMGLIDNSYCGDGDIWKFPALATRDCKIKKGDRICQFRIQKNMDSVAFLFSDHLNDEERGGFGSTGRN